ncbi:MAG TPA: MBOAT family O-acyltransferase [Draconibacterium sp.]|nr:MBOAT family O-acyltransferase [Draconibacterium sp.]
MLFNSLTFVVFAIIFFGIFQLVWKRVKGRLIWLCIASFFFYGWWDWRFLFLIIFSGLVDYFAALEMEKHPGRKKLFLILSVFANVASLSVFKYSGFIAENIDRLFNLTGNLSVSAHIPEFFLVTPVGISFYTFQSMSYTIDVYRKEVKPTRNIIQFFAYLSMFPQLVAGPIVRAKNMLPQLLKIPSVSNAEKWLGFQLIVHGYFKKMVIADNLAPYVVKAFSSPDLNSSSVYWWGVMITFAFQIYCDFAGYSDIARGLAKWMGYDFPDNFRHPYISTSFREFWTRWHISLSTWFRDYLYVPLGGNRKGKVKSHVFLWITMLISGLWHGAAWTFVVWGAIHAFFVSAERFIHWPKSLKETIAFKFFAWLTVSVLVLLAWVFFRADNFNQAIEIIQIMFAFKGPFNLDWGLNISFFLAIIILRELQVAWRLEIDWTKRPAASMVFYALLIVMIIFLRGKGSEFIYFQF